MIRHKEWCRIQACENTGDIRCAKCEIAYNAAHAEAVKVVEALPGYLIACDGRKYILSDDVLAALKGGE